MAKADISAHQYFTANPFVWLSLILKNRGIYWKKIPKAIVITIVSLITSPIQLAQYFYYLANRSKTREIEDPIFIIGHWRSGTTFLHYLMCKNPKFGYLTYFQGFLPTIALVGGVVVKKTLSFLIPKKRPQDNIEISSDLPHEEENSISNFSMYSASHSFFFPKDESFYNKFALLKGLTKREYKRWKGSYKRMIDEIAIAIDFKPLVVKNPHNTGRIKGLLDLYPNAKFIHIYRNPYDVIPSTYLMYDMVIRTQYLNDYSKEDTMNKIFYYYKTSMQQYFDQKSLIPKENLFEIKFEDFQYDAVKNIKDLYSQLNLDYTPDVDQKVKEYAESKKGYKKNVHKLEGKLKKRIEKECHFAFETLGYQPEQLSETVV
ncbi:MAG: sulfotransferase [Saprospiraceae bacterium]|nr:sulfotransferase [Saprospiraceae bacterium]